MRGLAALLDEQWSTLEADFQRYYHLDLRAALWGPDRERLGVRRLLALVEGLPWDSATMTPHAVEHMKAEREKAEQAKTGHRVMTLDEIPAWDPTTGTYVETT